MWEFFGFMCPLGHTTVDASVWAFKVNGEVLAQKKFQIWDDPKDRSVVNGITYILKPPTWESAMDKWFAEQKEVEKTFDSPEEYARYLKTVLALSE